MMDIDGLIERLNLKEDTGYRTSGGGVVAADGKCEMWGNLPITRLRNPDGPEASSELTRLRDEVKRLREALGKLRTTAALLQQNSEGCAVEHHGHDFQEFGMPGWLADTQADIEAARTALGDAG